MDVSKQLSVSFLLSVDENPDCKDLTFLFDYIGPAFLYQPPHVQTSGKFHQIPASAEIIKEYNQIALAMCKQSRIDNLSAGN